MVLIILLNMFWRKKDREKPLTIWLEHTENHNQRTEENVATMTSLRSGCHSKIDDNPQEKLIKETERPLQP